VAAGCLQGEGGVAIQSPFRRHLSPVLYEFCAAHSLRGTFHAFPPEELLAIREL
jgi:hypothetical protein